MTTPPSEPRIPALTCHSLRCKGSGVGALALFVAAFRLLAASDADFIPLPQDALPSTPPENPILDLAQRAIAEASHNLKPGLPEALVVSNDNGSVFYDSEKRTLLYHGPNGREIFLRTSEGQEIYARGLEANFEKRVAKLIGPLRIYQGETFTLAEDGWYNWEEGSAEVYNIRSKANGLLVRGTRAEYRKDAKGKAYAQIHDAFVSTEDVEKPGMWVGTGKLLVYPGDYGVISRLSVAAGEHDMPVPVLGWVTLSHSLNPREGYLPMPGAKSIWGAYLRNRYGVLLGNRRVERGIPVADYVATGLLDYRVRRGMAGGLEFTDESMRHQYSDMSGFAAYYAADKHPDINPTKAARTDVHHSRYRVALQAKWQLPIVQNPAAPDAARWSLTMNTNLLSDRYMLRDYFEDFGRVDDKPDNSVRLERRTRRDQTMLFTRFAPNDFYSADERTELSYYRVRSTLGESRIAYETRNSIGLMRQELPADLRVRYQNAISKLTDPDLRAYYTRLLNTHQYARLNSTHELSTSLNILRFLNITPKLGGGLSGYYGVDEVGADNRFLGYMSCDFDIKFHRRLGEVFSSSMGIDGLSHIFHPYATFSHGTISSAEKYVPQIDTWSTTLGSSTVNPMPLDLMSFTGIDGWSKWTVWRLGASNTISTIYDGESRALFSWNLFIDYNIDNPSTESSFSNLYSIVTLAPTRRTRLHLETQTPTIHNGDGFSQYNTTLSYLPTRWLETRIGHRYIRSHPVQSDASQLSSQFNIRLSEKYSASTRLYWDVEAKRIPIQQYSVFRKFGAWYVGSTLFLRDNGGKKETGFGLSFTLGETGTSLPVNFF